MEIVGEALGELPWFLAYLAIALGLTLAYLVIYMWITPHEELGLIRDNNPAAAIALGGSLLGFSLPLASSIAHSDALVDCALWGMIAIVVQVLVFYLVRLPIPKISERIEQGETASGLWLGAASLAGGLLNAACMTD